MQQASTKYRTPPTGKTHLIATEGRESIKNRYPILVLGAIKRGQHALHYQEVREVHSEDDDAAIHVQALSPGGAAVRKTTNTFNCRGVKRTFGSKNPNISEQTSMTYTSQYE